MNTDATKDNSTPEGGAEVITNLDNLIKTHVTRIDNLKVEAKKFKEMLDDALANDSTYKLHDDEAKKAAKVKSATKAQILQQPGVAATAEKVKSSRAEIKELEAALSDYLREYQRLTGVNEIEGADGEVREIIYVAKLVKKSSRSR
jgi:hypothetical protein